MLYVGGVVKIIKPYNPRSLAHSSKKVSSCLSVRLSCPHWCGCIDAGVCTGDVVLQVRSGAEGGQVGPLPNAVVCKRRK